MENSHFRPEHGRDILYTLEDKNKPRMWKKLTLLEKEQRAKTFHLSEVA